MHEIYRKMEWDGFINPQVRLPADHAHRVDVLKNGELRRSELLEGLDFVVNAPCLEWDSNRSKRALDSAKSKAKKEIDPIVDEINGVMASYKTEKEASRKKLDEKGKEFTLQAHLARSQNNKTAYERIIEDNNKVFCEIQRATLKSIDEKGRKLIALSRRLPEFIDCAARKNYVNALKEGLSTLLAHRSGITLSMMRAEKWIDDAAVDIKTQIDKAQMEYLKLKEANQKKSNPTSAERDAERKKHEQVVILNVQLKKLVKEKLAEGLPRSWEVLHILFEEVEAHEKLQGESGADKAEGTNEKDFQDALINAIGKARRILSTVAVDRLKFDLKSDKSISTADAKSLERKRADISRGENAALPATDYGKLPGWVRLMREIGDVATFVTNTTHATVAIVYTEKGLSKEERSREKAYALADKLERAASDYRALRLNLFEYSKGFPPECKEETASMLNELEYRAFMAHAEGWLLRIYAKYKLESVPPQVATEEGKDNAAKTAVTWTSQAALKEEEQKEATTPDAEVEVIDSLPELPLEETAFQEERKEGRRESVGSSSPASPLSRTSTIDTKLAETEKVGSPVEVPTSSSPVEERKAEESGGTKIRRGSMSLLARADSMRELRLTVNDLQKKGQEHERRAGSEMSRHTSARTYATKSDALGKAIDQYVKAAEQYDKAIKAMEDANVSDLGSISLSELDAKRRNCYNKAELRRAFQDSPKSAPLDLQGFRILFKGREFTVRLPKDRPHFLGTREGQLLKNPPHFLDTNRKQLANQILEVEIEMKPVTSENVKGSLRVPGKHYAHFHYDEDGNLVFASVKTEKYRELAHLIFQEENEETGESQEKKVPVPRVVLPEPDRSEFLRYCVSSLGLSRVWL